MPEMRLRHPAAFNKSGFIHSACGRSTKTKERVQKSKETGDSRYIYQNQLGKACFQHDIEFLRIYLEEQLLVIDYVIKYLILLKVQNMMVIKEVLLQWFINVFMKSLQVVLLHVHGQKTSLREINLLWKIKLL